jgi:gliding motility associated protien GldN
MKRLSLISIFSLLMIAVLALPSQAQEMENDLNPNSLRPIPEHDQMFKKRIWRRIDLKEKQNRSFFARGNEISKLMIEAVKDGRLVAYSSDSLQTPLSKEKFFENLQTEDAGGEGLSEEEKELGFTEDDWGGDGWGDDAATEGDGWGDDAEAKKEDGTDDAYEFYPDEISVLELMEDWIIDKNRSRLYYDILSIKLIIPAEKFSTGVYREVATFKYKDLVEVWRQDPKTAIWFNGQNSAEHRSLEDAFALRLFKGRITKFSNPNDDKIIDIYNSDPKAGLWASERYEQELMEIEHNLWSY